MKQPDIFDAPHLLMESLRRGSSLLRAELRLAKAEIAQNLSRAALGLGFLVIAALLALVGLNVLAGALVAWVAAQGVGAALAALVVGGGLLLVGLCLALLGKSRLSIEALRPDRAEQNLREDFNSVKEAARHG